MFCSQCGHHQNYDTNGGLCDRCATRDKFQAEISDLREKLEAAEARLGMAQGACKAVRHIGKYVVYGGNDTDKFGGTRSE